MAEYINNYPDRTKLKIMFMRDSPGVYHFGTRKVNIKLEQHGNIKVRVGGGYLSLDEFLDQYTPIELEKMERSNSGTRQLLRKSSGISPGRRI